MISLANAHSMLELLLYRLNHSGDKPLFHALDSQRNEFPTALSVRQIVKNAIRFGQHWQLLHLNSASALVLLPQGLDFIQAFFSCLYNGKTIIPFPYPADNQLNDVLLQKLKGIHQQAGCSLILTTSDLADQLRASPLAESYRIYEIESCPEELNEPKVHPQSHPHLIYLFTSGSTAQPKGVIHSHRGFLHNGEKVCRDYHYSENSLTVSWLPQFHAFGILVNILYPLCSNSPVYIMSPADFALNPLLWLEWVSRLKATHIAAASFGFDLCVQAAKSGIAPDLDLSKVQIAFASAEPVRKEIFDRFNQVFGPQGFQPEAFRPLYGMSEGSTISARRDNKRFFLALNPEGLRQNKVWLNSSSSSPAVTPMNCGLPLEGMEVIAVDPDNHEKCGPEEIGEIWWRGPSSFLGYLQALPEVWGKVADHQGPDFFRTGDLGFVHEGEVYLTGRIKEVMIVRGKNHYPADIEQLIAQQFPVLLEARKAVFSQTDEEGQEQIVAVIEWPQTSLPKEKGRDLADDINRVIVRQQEISLSRLVFVPQDSIPRTASGKIQRRNCKIALQNHRLPQLFNQTFDRNRPSGPEEDFISIASVQTREEVLQILLEGFAGVFKVKREQLGPKSVLIHLGLDSIQLLRLSSWLNKKFFVEVALKDLIEQRDIGSLANFILAQTSSFEISQESKNETAFNQHSYPLSINQKGLWYAYQREPKSSVRYNVPVLYELPPEIDEVRLQKAFQQLQQRYPVLRMQLKKTAGLPQWQIAAEPVPLQVEASALSKAECIESLNRQASQAFLPETDQALFFGKWIKLPGQGGSLLYMQASHLLLDGRSCQLLLLGLESLYADPESEAIHPEKGFLQFALVEETSLNEIGEQRVRDFWLAQKERLFQPMRLPARNAVQKGNFSAARLIKKLKPETVRQIQELSQSLLLTPFSLMLSAFLLMLYRYSRQSRLTVGVPFLNRTDERFENSIGYFSNVLPFSVELDPETPFAAFAQNTLDQIFALLPWQNYPFTKLVETLGLSDQAFFEVLFSFQNLMGDQNKQGLFQANYEVYQTTTGDLTFEVIAEPDEWTLLAKYNAARFETEMVESWLAYYLTLLEKLAEDHQLPIGDLLALKPAERQLLQSWNKTKQEIPAIGNLYSLFVESVKQHPGKAAIVFQDDILTYEELERTVQSWVIQFTHQGLKSQDRVALILSPSFYQPVAILACLALGVTYVPIDPDLPFARQKIILRDVDPALILTDEAESSSLFHDLGKCLPVRDLLTKPLNGQARAFPVARMGAQELVNIIYTSGSTGEPKGVAVRHSSLMTFYFAIKNRVGLDSTDRLLATSHYAFDISFTELIAPLLSGAQTVIADQQVRKNPEQIHAILKDREITWLQGTPAFWSMLLPILNYWPTSLKTLITTGEALTEPIAAALLKADAMLWNLYGPTEATIQVCGKRVKTPDVIDIGRPFDNVEMFVLDQAMNMLPVGVPGKLYLGGPFLAHSYWKRPGLSAEKFIASPEHLGAKSERLYDTGDLAYWTAEGRIKLQGRSDRQVKLRGYRMELREVEKALRKHPDIRDCRVEVIRGETPAFDHLKACLLLVAESQVPDFMDLRRHLLAYLPAYMIPGVFWIRKQFPLLSSGKVAVGDLFKEGYQLAPNDTASGSLHYEKTVQQIWAELLNITAVPVNRNFFDLGGTSLMLVELRTGLNQNFPLLNASMVDLFQHTTIQAQARWIEEVGAGDEPPAPTLPEVNPTPARQPLSRREIRKRRRLL